MKIWTASAGLDSGQSYKTPKGVFVVLDSIYFLDSSLLILI